MEREPEVANVLTCHIQPLNSALAPGARSVPNRDYGVSDDAASEYSSDSNGWNTGRTRSISSLLSRFHFSGSGGDPPVVKTLFSILPTTRRKCREGRS